MIRRGAGLALLFTLSAGFATARAQQSDASPPDSSRGVAACGACLSGIAVGLRASNVLALGDTGRQKAIEYSEGYGIRLKVHLIASYFELPLFVGEYFLGEKLLRDERNGVDTHGSSVKSAHSAVALGLGALFGVNTVTGVWNLIEARHDPAGRFRRWLHSLAMLAADAGFMLTANAAGDARRSDAGANTHRNLAIGSMSLAAASTIMMWLWKD